MDLAITILCILLFICFVIMFIQARERNKRIKTLLDNIKKMDNEFFGKYCENCDEDNLIGKNIVMRNPDGIIFCCQECYEEWVEKNRDK